MIGFLVAEALRDLRRAGRVAISAILLITLSLAALGGFWLVSSNIGQATDEWRNRVRIMVFLKRDSTTDEGHALAERAHLGELQDRGRQVDVADELVANDPRGEARPPDRQRHAQGLLVEELLEQQPV